MRINLLSWFLGLISSSPLNFDDGMDAFNGVPDFENPNAVIQIYEARINCYIRMKLPESSAGSKWNFENPCVIIDQLYQARVFSTNSSTFLFSSLRSSTGRSGTLRHFSAFGW